MQYFLFAPGELIRGLEQLAILNEFFYQRSQSAKEVFAGRDRYAEVLWPPPSHHTLYGQQTGDVIDRQAPICIRLHFKALGAGFPVEENEGFRMNCEVVISAMDCRKDFSAFHGPPNSIDQFQVDRSTGGSA